MAQIRAKDIDSLTVDDIVKWRESFVSKAMIIDVQDDLNPEQLAKLIALAREAKDRPYSKPLDTNALSERLQNISRDSPDSTSTATTAGPDTLEEQVEIDRSQAYQDYNELVQMGGRPSRDINPDPGPCPASKSDVDKEYHESDHWHRELRRIQTELERWQHFRMYQKAARANEEKFVMYKERVMEFRQTMSLQDDFELSQDWQTQSKLDEWREFHTYVSRKVKALEKKLENPKRMNSATLWKATNDFQELSNLRPWTEEVMVELTADSAASNPHQTPMAKRAQRIAKRPATRPAHSPRVTKPKQKTNSTLNLNCNKEAAFLGITTKAKSRAPRPRAADGAPRRSQRVATQNPRRSARIAQQMIDRRPP